jgi:Putative Actinobacterial Holin-X, holin superfamily III
LPHDSGWDSEETVPQEEKSIPQVMTELWEMLVSYAKQETVEPLKGLGRFIAFGAGAALLGGIGIIMITLAGLRGLQDHNDGHLSGNWTWVPYLVALVLLGVLIAIAVSRIKPKKEAR